MHRANDSDSSFSFEGDYESVDSSDIDELLLSSSQSGVLSRQLRKRRKQDQKRSKSRVTASTPVRNVAPEIRELLGEANNAYLKRDYPTAIDLLEETIRLAPGLSDPFLTLGLIYTEMGDAKRSLESLLLAVHLTPGDAKLWQRIAGLSREAGNIQQAIYCYNRCLRISGGNEILMIQRECLWEVSMCHSEIGDFEKAARNLRKLMEMGPSDGTVTKELARCLYNTNEKEEAAELLEQVFQTQKDERQVDANLVNMLCEVYLDLREWLKCLEALTQILDMDSLATQPIDLVAKLGVASTFADRFYHLTQQSVDAVIAYAVSTGDSELPLPLADALFESGKYALAANLLSSLPLSQDVAVRLGRCHYEDGQYLRAVELLEPYFSNTASRADPNLVVMLADAWRRVGRTDEADNLLLQSLSYEDLKTCRQLPKATSNTARRQTLTRLQNLLISHSNLVDSEDITCTPLRQRFADSALSLLWDCELDMQRVARHRVTNTSVPEKVEDMRMVDDNGLLAFVDSADAAVPGSRAAAFWKLRKELDLEGVDDLLGDYSFVDFLETCSKIWILAGRAKEGVELIENILSNKRKRWSAKTSIVETSKTLTEVAECILFDLSVKAGLNKVGYKYLRSHVVAALEAGDEPAVRRAFSEISKLVFTGSQRSHKEVIEQRSWLMRQAVKHPVNFSVFVMCGHFCVYSNNYRDASAEYLRAVHMAPNDPFPLLCLASSLLCLSMSRTTRDRHLKVLEAFAVLDRYRRLRRAQRPNDALLIAETHYNAGRALHQLTMSTLAEAEYLKCLGLLEGVAGHSLQVRCAYALGSLYQHCGNIPGAARTFARYIVL